MKLEEQAYLNRLEERYGLPQYQTKKGKELPESFLSMPLPGSRQAFDPRAAEVGKRIRRWKDGGCL